jgi:hypothetical protein
MKRVDRQYQSLSNSIKKELLGRYVYFFEGSDFDLPIPFIIAEYRTFSNELVLKRLFDENQILIEHP